MVKDANAANKSIGSWLDDWVLVVTSSATACCSPTPTAWASIANTISTSLYLQEQGTHVTTSSVFRTSHPGAAHLNGCEIRLYALLKWNTFTGLDLLPSFQCSYIWLKQGGAHAVIIRKEMWAKFLDALWAGIQSFRTWITHGDSRFVVFIKIVLLFYNHCFLSVVRHNL